MPRDSVETNHSVQPEHPSPKAPVSRLAFLRDVLICSLGAYGGPETHISVFLDQLVVKRRYLSETDLIELIALCSILPGPTSSQTIVSVGYKMGGPVLALLTMLVWSLPVLVVMTALSFLYRFLEARAIPLEVLRFVGPMAVGFIIVAAFRIGRKVVVDRTTAVLMLFGAVVTYFIRAPWVFPVVLLLGGAVTITASAEQNLWNRVKLNPPWRYLVVFAAIAVGGLFAASVSQTRLIQLFESFYRYGYLVFGGGQVIVPVMYSELVEIRGYLSNQEFLTGYGLVQGLPGPMFSFAAYAGGMAARDGSTAMQIAGAAAGGVGIFLPGLLLIYFVYPVWEQLKEIRAIRVALKGIGAVAGGLIAVAAVILAQTSGFAIDNLIVTAAAMLLLLWKRFPAPLIVAITLIAGFVV
ncbi:MAG: chromate efflux transporter [Spirochaetaceae bacterium]|nr:MAG: chromate efflux transporter [Spirochaetaceae bacterium]